MPHSQKPTDPDAQAAKNKQRALNQQYNRLSRIMQQGLMGRFSFVTVEFHHDDEVHVTVKKFNHAKRRIRE